MSGFDITPGQEDKIYQELTEAASRERARRATITPQMAQTTGMLYRNHPYAPPGLLMSAAGAMSSGMMTEDQANNMILRASQNQLMRTVTEQKPRKKSWWERNIFDKAKTASRWTFAGLNFVPDVLTNVASQLFDETPSTSGLFISTSLGSLIANDEVAGDGWFMGGKALEMQAERARQYRGEIGGHAWTFGRGFASLVAQPGSKEFNILSGLVDAGAQLAIPAIPGPALKGLKAVKSEFADVAGLRSLAGLTNFESAMIVPQKVAGFLDSRTGQALVTKISKINSMDEALSTFKDVQHMDFINKIVDLTDEGEIRQYLMKTLGSPMGTVETGLAGKAVSTIDQINIGRLSDVKNLVGRVSFVGRMMATVPGRHLVLYGGNARDVAQTVRNLNNYLKILRVDPTKADDLVGKFSNALVNNNGDVYSVMEQFDEIFQESMRAMGAPDEAIKVFRDGMKDFQKSKDVYGAIGSNGKPTAYGARVRTTDGDWVHAPSSTAQLESEMLNQLTLVLPDPARVRRAMSQIGWIFGKGDKLSNPEDWRKLRLPLSALHGFQTEIWRPVTLMTGGYVLRNMTESAVRYSMTPGLKGGILHPLEWMQIASMKKFRGMLTGVKWQDMTEDAAARIAKQGVDEFDIATGQSLREIANERSLFEYGAKNRVWSRASRQSNEYGKGIRDELTLLHDDSVSSRVAEGFTTDEILEDFEANPGRYVRDLQGAWTNREVEMVGKPNTRTIASIEFLDNNGKLTEVGRENLRSYIEDLVRPRVNEVTGNHPILREVVARGDSKFVDADGVEYDIFTIGKGGRRVGYSKEFERAVERAIKEDADRLARGEAPILKEWYKYSIETKKFTVEEAGELGNWMKSRNKVTDWMFGYLYPKRSQYLMQSPVFRQYYWDEVGKFVDELDQQSLNRVRELLAKTAEDEGKKLTRDWLADYVGSSKGFAKRFERQETLADRLYARLENPTATGKLSLDELDAYAKGSALDRTKNLFYNASEKSNFADIMQIIVPFGTAWAETMKAMTKIAMSNPNATRRVGVSVQGLAKADPDGDGKGFFWKDPVTGEYVFNYPFSDQIGGLAAALIPTGAALGGILGGAPGIAIGALAGGATGFGAQEALGLESTRIVAPVKSMSMALNILPGAGPFVQIAANRILTKIPQADAIRDAILPYGEPDITTVGPIPVPSWARKVIDGIVADPDSSRLLGDLTIDVMRVLNASGEYDLSNEDDKLRLEEDAISRARTLLIFRGLGQLVGPTRPDTEFEIATKQGDKYTTELSKAFRQMQTENYDTAVERFISTFGEDAFLYVQGKSEAQVGGLDASTKFGRFERQNGDLFAKYPAVAGYFADVGTNFDFAVYTRQLETGKRKKIKPSEYIDLAQQTVGRALYKASQRAVGANPDDYQKEVLRSIKSLIEKQFPGYTKIVIDVNKEKARMKELIQASVDPALDGNPIAEALRVYFQYRDQALTELAGRGIVSGDLTVKSAADLRARLRIVADTLVGRYPEFERLYDRALYSEVEGM